MQSWISFEEFFTTFQTVTLWKLVNFLHTGKTWFIIYLSVLSFSKEKVTLKAKLQKLHWQQSPSMKSFRNRRDHINLKSKSRKSMKHRERVPVTTHQQNSAVPCGRFNNILKFYDAKHKGLTKKRCLKSTCVSLLKPLQMTRLTRQHQWQNCGLT